MPNPAEGVTPRVNVSPMSGFDGLGTKLIAVDGVAQAGIIGMAMRNVAMSKVARSILFSTSGLLPSQNSLDRNIRVAQSD